MQSEKPSNSQGRSKEKYVRNYPMGMKKLQEIKDMPADVVVMHLCDKRSGFDQLLESNLDNEKLILLIDVLSKACSADSVNTGITEIFVKIFNDPFRSKFVSYLIGLDDFDYSFLNSLLCLFKFYKRFMPHNAYDNLPPLLKSVKLMILANEGSTCFKEIDGQFKSLTDNFAAQIKPSAKGSKVRSFDNDRMKFIDSIEPNEDFRTLTVEPTIDDIAVNELPLVRRIIVDGHFKDTDTYLDVMFRLLREDFIRPLREGINEFMSSPNSKNRNVNVYKNCRLLYADMMNNKLIYKLKFGNQKYMAGNKRLMYGNLLCISNDNFKSFIIASIEEKNEKSLKEGVIGIELITKNPALLKTACTVLESKSYFKAYKHVLMSLQRLDIESLPFIEHIVEVNRDVEPPEYVLETNSIYDLSKICSNKDPSLKTIDILSDDWPNGQELGLDDSQQRALKAALTQRVALIQGPPGTGKTFLGKKITRLLLNNSGAIDVPILVVCYTNHALDQFLEGMLSFTRLIVRMGSRSNNEEIMKLNITNQLRELQKNREIPLYIHNRTFELRDDLARIGEVFVSLNKIKRDVYSNRGIIELSTFRSKNIIDSEVCRQLGGSLRNWLLNCPITVGNNVFNCFKSETKPEHNDAISPEDWADILENRRQMQEGRILAVDDDEEEQLRRNEVESPVKFAVRLSDIEREIGFLEDKLKSNSVSEHDFHSMTQKIERLRKDYATVEFIARCKQSVNVVNYDVTAINSLTFEERCSLYAKWKSELVAYADLEIENIEPRLKTLQERSEEIRDAKYLYIARQNKIVGMTTTGAAQFRNVIQDLKPRIGEIVACIYFCIFLFHSFL